MIADKKWLTLLIVLFGLILFSSQAYAWADADYNYRQRINLNTDGIGLSGSITNDHAIHIDINSANTNFWSGLKRADCNDIKLYAANDSTPLDYYIEECRTDINKMAIWAEITDSFSSSADTNVYLYYGFAAASSSQNVVGTYPSTYISAYNFDLNLEAARKGTNLVQSGVINQYDLWGIGKNANSLGNLTQGFSITNYNNQTFSIIGMASSPNIAPTPTYRMIWSDNRGAPVRGDLWIQTSVLNWVAPVCSGGAATISGIANDVKFHFVGTSHDTLSGIIYLNGYSSSSCANSTDPSAAPATGFLMKHPSASNYGLDGNLDAFRIINYQLSSDEAKLIYSADMNNNTLLKFNAQEVFTTPLAQARLTLNIYRTGTSDHLTGVNLDSNINAWDFSNQTSPQTTSYVDQNTSYDLNFTKTGYDANYSTGVADTNKTLTIYLTDSTAPIVGQAKLTGFTYYNSTYITGSGITSATATDTGSDINSSGCYYSIDNGSTWLSADKNATHCYKSVAITDQNYTFKFRAIDNANNTGTGTSSTTYVGDASPPTTSITFNQITNTTDANIYLTCTDAGAGCKGISYSINGASYTDILFDNNIQGNDYNSNTITDDTSHDFSYEYARICFNEPELHGLAPKIYLRSITNQLFNSSDGFGTYAEAKYKVYFTDGTNEFTDTQTNIGSGTWTAETYAVTTQNKDVNCIGIYVNQTRSFEYYASIKDTNAIFDLIYDFNNPLNVPFSGTGIHSIDYYSTDLLDLNETPASFDFNIYGFLHLKMFEETDYTIPFTGDIRFNGTDYNNVSSVDLNLQTITANLYAIDFTEGSSYGARHYILDLNLFTDTNVNMLMLDTTNGTILPYLVFKPDALTPYANARVYIYKPNQNDYTIGTYYTDVSGLMSVFTSLTDQNYLFDINNGEETYQPVALTIKVPISEETNLVIDGNFRVRISGAGLNDYNNQNSDVLTYLLPNITTHYIIKVRDVNGVYLERTYFKSYKGNPLSDILQPYLISVANGFLATITTYNVATYQTQPDIQIKIYKTLIGGRTLVEEIFTDSKGQGLIQMILSNQYEFETYFDGNFVKTFNITATSNTIVIYLSLSDILIQDTNASGYAVRFTLFGNGKIKQSVGNLTLNPTLSNLGSKTITAVSRVYQNGTLLSTNSWTGSDINHTFTNTIAWADINIGTIQNTITVTYGAFTYPVFSQSYSITDAFETNYSIVDGLKTGLRSDLGCSADGWCNPLLVIGLIICIALGLYASVLMGQFSSQATGLVFVVSMIIFTYLTWIPWELCVAVILIALGFIVNERRS